MPVLPEEESAPPPSIASVEPPSATVSATVTISGAGFGTEAGRIFVGEQEAAVLSWSETTVLVQVPDLPPGDREITVVGAGGSATTHLRIVLPSVAFVNEDRASGNAVSAFRIDVAPEAVPSSPFLTGAAAAGFGGDARSIALHAPTRRLFATNEDSVSVFAVDGATGALTPVPGSPFAAGASRCFGIAVSPDGSRVYVASYASSTIVVLSVSQDGVLSPVPGSPFALAPGGGPDSLDLTPDGRFLVVNLEDLQAMEVLELGPDGAPRRISGSPFAYASGAFAYSIRLDPEGGHVYVPDSFQERIAVYRLDPESGAPTEVPGSPFPAAGMIHGLAFAPDGTRLFAATDDPAALLHVFSIGEDGFLTPVAGSPFSSGLSDTSSIAVTSDGSGLFVLDESSNRLAAFRVQASSGALEPVASVSLDGDGQPSGLVLAN